MDLHYLSAHEALHLFKTRQLSPVELMQAVIVRAERVEPQINAFSYRYFDEALAAARQAEERYQQGDARPLEGIPLAVKDEAYMAGRITSNGSLLLTENVATHTSPYVERLLAAGAIVHARTTTPEFSITAVTWSKLWGVTRNPWNLALTPGGSSGGSAAALAAGSALLATGSDIGGSIRIPAAMCGVIGFKPPYGRVPEDPPFNLEYYNHIGPLARTVRDCALFENVIAGPHPRDIATLKPKLTIPEQLGDIRGWRIACSLDLGYFAVDAETERNTLAALDVFRSLGATVENVELGWQPHAYKAAIDHILYGPSGPLLLQAYESNQDALTPYVRHMAERAQRVTRQEALQAEYVAGEMYHRLGAIFEEYDLLICPTLATNAIPATFDHSVDSLTVKGVPYRSLAWLMTYPFNMLSRCPVLNVPAGQANGAPTGIQLVGPSYEDVKVFQAGAAYEAAVGPFIHAGNCPQL